MNVNRHLSTKIQRCVNMNCMTSLHDWHIMQSPETKYHDEGSINYCVDNHHATNQSTDL